MARREPHPTTLFGKTLGDDYFWLRHKDTPEVLAYLRAENEYADAQMAGTAALQKTLYDEMVSRTAEDDESPPYRQGTHLYFSRVTKGAQYPVYLRKKAHGPHGADAAEEVVLDLNALARDGGGKAFVSVAAMAISDDENEVAYLEDTAGFRQYVLRTKNLVSGTTSALAIPLVDGVAFSADGKSLYYVTEDAQTKRPDKLFHHAIGSDPSTDVLLFEEKDEMYTLNLDRSRSKRFLFVTSASKTTSEVRLVDLHAKDPRSAAAAPRVVAARRQNVEYYCDDHGADLFLLTNDTGRNFRLAKTPIASTDPSHWAEVVAERPQVMLEGMQTFAHQLVLSIRKDALPTLEVLDFATGKTRLIPQHEAVYDLRTVDNHELDQKAVRVRYDSPTTVPTYIDYDLATGAPTILQQQQIPGFDPARYETARVQITARDGSTQIPVSLVYARGTKPDGTHPLFLYGYGSYGISIVPGYSARIPSLLDRGMVYALAHIRGGGDLGKRWHDQGRLEHKMNTFTDFLDVAAGLKKAGWAKPDAVVAEGGSAGGLLMGAVANLQPDAFKAVVAMVPFVDVMNTMLDETLPLTVGEYEEWGNPHVEPDFDRMRAYSPYDNISAQAYPAMLVRTSYNDSQVMYWEPAKYVARLRATKTDANPLYFKTNLQPAGHGGQSGRYDRLKDVAFTNAFILHQVGIDR